MTVVRPLRELHLGNELRRYPHNVVLPDARHLGHPAKRRRLPLERLQLAQEPVDLRVVEARAHVPDVRELAAASYGEHERAEPRRTAALALGVAGNQELLA